MRQVIGLSILLLVGIAGLSFAALNSSAVSIDYYFGQLSAPISLILVFAVTAGAVLGVLASMGLVLSQRLELNALRKRLNLCEREIQNLRELPFKDRQ